jgi:hypothetical protein
MDNLTVFLAQLWGPAILAVGLGVFLSRRYYLKIYRELEKDSLAVLAFGLMAMAAGTAQVLFHNAWDSFAAGLVSFLGWATLAKGALFVVAPGLVDASGDYWASRKLVSLSGLLCLAGGAYLVWFGYF